MFLSLIDGKPNGAPAQIQVPQFAYLTTEGGEQLRVVVVQARRTSRARFSGCATSPERNMSERKQRSNYSA